MANRAWDLSKEEYLAFMEKHGYEVNPRFLEVKDNKYRVYIAQEDELHSGIYAITKEINEFLDKFNRPESTVRLVPVSLSVTASRDKLDVVNYTGSMIYEEIGLYHKPCEISDVLSDLDLDRFRQPPRELEVDDEIYEQEKAEKALLEQQARELMAQAEGVDGL